MSAVAGLTAPQKLLLVAAKIEAAGVEQWCESILVIEAWKEFPDTFGLDGFRKEYPDNNTVRVSLCGANGLIGKGYLDRVAPKTYRLTKDGAKAVKLIASGNGAAVAKRAKLAPVSDSGRMRAKVEEIALQLLGSVAYRYWRSGQRDRIIFGHALAFWGVQPNERIEPRIQITTDNIAALHDTVTRYAARLSTGQVLLEADVMAMAALNGWLVTMFARRIEKLAS